MSNSESDTVRSALRKLDALYETLPPAEQQVISHMVRQAVTPPEEQLKEDVSGYASSFCRGVADNNAPRLLGSLTTGVGVSAGIFMLEAPPSR
ncbi:MAG: hypothetical protein ACRDJE_20955 [Dehalococcoidia bacterium]